MKMRILVCLVLVGVLGSCSSAEKTPFPQFVNEFVTNSLAFSPIGASAAGYHQHQGQPLDSQVDDLSAQAFDRQRGFYRDFEGRLQARVDAGGLGAQELADIGLIRGVIAQALVELDSVQRYKHDPTLYTDLFGSAVFNPLVLEYAPIETRYQHIITRMKQLAGLLGQARQNLVDAPDIMRETAIRANDANRDLIVATLREKAPPGAVRQLETAQPDVLRAIDEFGKFLREDLSKKRSDWRLGPEKYKAQFAAVLGITTSPDTLLTDAQTELEHVRAQAAELAGPMHDKLFPGQPRGETDKMVRRVLDRIAQTHSTAETYLEDARADLAETTAFVREKDFMPMPAGTNLQVIPTPEFLRGVYAVGGFNAAPPLEPKLGAFYWITPLNPSWEPARVESKLREYNRWGLKILTIHEAMPGHYLQFEFANTVQPAERRVLRAVYGSGPYVEGWGVYATELMIEQGYLANEPEMKLNWYKLRAVANTILDVSLQTKGMTDEQAISLMIDKTYQEKEEADAKLVRAKLTSSQLPTYFAGWREWRRIRDAEKARLGGGFNLKAFHEKALRSGGVRLADLPRLLAAK
jgi:uncharacterized protein (DUF885 family)